MFKKLLSSLLALVLILALVPAALANTDTKLEDYTDVMDLTGYFDQSPAFGDENLGHEWIKENLKINIIGSFNSGDSAANKLAQMVATDDMPDVVYVGRSCRTIAQEMIDAGMVAAADDYFDVMPNYLKWREGAINDYWANEEDGKHYMLPGFVYPPEYAEELGCGDPMVMAIRQDVLDATGMEMPKTLDEFYDLLVASKKAFEGKGGIYEGFIPFGIFYFTETEDSNANMLTNAYGLNGSNLKVDDENGKIVESFMTEEWSSGTRFAAKLVREGLLDPDCITSKTADLLEKGKQGKYGVLWASISDFGDNIEGAIDRLGIEADYVCMELPGVNGTENTNWLYKNSLGSSIGLVSAKAKDKERIFKFIDWQNTPVGNMIIWNGGPSETESWFYINENGEGVYNPKIGQAIQNGEMDTNYISPWTYWIAGLGVVLPSDINASIINSPGVRPFHQASRDIGMKQVYNDPKIDAYRCAQKGEEYEARWTDIKAIADEYRANLILHSKDDAEFDATLQKMYDELGKAGIDIVEEENYKLYCDVNNK